MTWAELKSWVICIPDDQDNETVKVSRLDDAENFVIAVGKFRIDSRGSDNLWIADSEFLSSHPD